MRFSKKDQTTYLRTQCRAKMRRTITYDIDISLDEHGNIQETQCECAAGMGPHAHCKHIRAAFLPLISFTEGKCMKLELTCTETTQSFHRPRRLHNGSPIKSDDLELSNTTDSGGSWGLGALGPAILWGPLQGRDPTFPSWSGGGGGGRRALLRPTTVSGAEPPRQSSLAGI